jgi:hypothetical protein
MRQWVRLPTVGPPHRLKQRHCPSWVPSAAAAHPTLFEPPRIAGRTFTPNLVLRDIPQGRRREDVAALCRCAIFLKDGGSSALLPLMVKLLVEFLHEESSDS